jgi:hypothetical protein
MECPKPVRWEPPKTEVISDYDAVDRFLEDLGRLEDICENPAVHPRYEKFKRFVCNGDVDAVADVYRNDVIAFATYYLIFHKRDLNTAQRALELLEFRDLDDEEEAMLKVLKAAYKAAANPPCDNPELMAQHIANVEKVPGLTGRVRLLQALVLMHLTGEIDAERFKDKIEHVFEERKSIVWHCDKVGCNKETIYHPLPFHHFAFYIVDRVKPLCPQEQPKVTTFEECLDEEKNRRRIASIAQVPLAIAVLALLFHKVPILFATVSVFYLLWTIYRFVKEDVPVCTHRVWSQNSWMLEVGFLVPLGVYIYTGLSAAAINPPDLSLLIPSVFGLLAALGGYAVYAILEPYKPHGIDFPKAGARDESREYRRFLDDLADAWNEQSLCEGWLPFEHYNKLRALLCKGDIEAAQKVSENYPLALMAYYFMFHKRDVETAEKVLNILRSRNLDEKDKAALEILELAHEATKSCNDPKALRQYVEEISNVQTYGWASMLKTLVLVHLINDEDYKEDVKLAVLWTIKNCQCDNLSVCHFAYRMLGKAKPLCPG